MSFPLLYLVTVDILLDNFMCYRGSLGCIPGGNVLHRIAVKVRKRLEDKL
jgi:hypothetical protein